LERKIFHQGKEYSGASIQQTRKRKEKIGTKIREKGGYVVRSRRVLWGGEASTGLVNKGETRMEEEKRNMKK